MKPLVVDNNGWYGIEGEAEPISSDQLSALGAIAKLSITKRKMLTVSNAKALQSASSISWLWLWCDVTRCAMREVLEIRNLKTLDVLALGAGKARGYSRARSLEVFRCGVGIAEQDLIEIAKSQSIKEVQAQSSKFGQRAISALMDMPTLYSIDIEGSSFDDQMAKLMSRSSQITKLDVGNTKISGVGLRALCKMSQLRSLDLWANDLSINDLENLRALPRLDYLSIGNAHGYDDYDPEQVVQLLLSLPSLKRVWLDGITLSDLQRAKLRAVINEVRC